MNRIVKLALVSALSGGCASLTPQGAEVKVYQANVAREDAPTPPLPQGCRVLATSGPIEQQQQERQTYDPYLAQRNETAAKKGNVLLVKSYRFMTLKRTECSESDARACPDSAQNWYKVSFESYACDGSGLAALAELKPAPSTGLFEWTLKQKEPPPAAAAPAAMPAPSDAPGATVSQPPVAAPSARAAALKSKILALMQEGVGSDVIVAFVRSNRPAPALTAEEIIDWKKSGISDDVIRATFSN